MSVLRVGVLLDGPRLAAWAAWTLRAIAEHRDLTLALAVLLPAPRPAPAKLFALYERLDRWVFATQPDASQTVDCSALLAGVPREAAEVDVMVRLGGARPSGELLRAARHGVWSLRWGRLRDPAPPLLWELAAPAPVVECVLERLTEDGAELIARSSSRTDVVSLERNRNVAYWKGAQLVVRGLEDLAAGRRRAVAGHAASPPGAAPSNADAVRLMGAVTARVTRRKLHAAVRQHQWFLGVRRRRGDRLPQEDPSPWRRILPPHDRSYADPFVVRHGGETFLLVEELLHDSGRGRLAAGRLEPDGDLPALEPILPCEHHTSYPYVFGHDGKLFLIPESGDARKVTLFAARRFPHDWEPVATLLDGVNAVDATVHVHAGRFWMWVSVAAPGTILGDETFLYFSDRLDRGWTPHPFNPVISDARTARPAGRPFLHRGRLIRPSQNSAERYGGRVVFNEVTVLTPDAYREHPCGSLGAEWAGRGTLAAHTYTFDGDWEATDVLRTFPRLSRARR